MLAIGAQWAIADQNQAQALLERGLDFQGADEGARQRRLILNGLHTPYCAEQPVGRAGERTASNGLLGLAGVKAD